MVTRYRYEDPTGWINLQDPTDIVPPGGIGPPPPPPPSGDIILGGSFSAKAGVDNKIYQGRAKSSRIFFTNTNLAGVSMAGKDTLQNAIAAGCDTLIVSAKDPNPANWGPFIRTCPSAIKNLYVVYYHEPIDNLTSDVWKNNWIKVAPAMASAGGIPTSILQAWVLFGAAYNSDDWVPPVNLVPVQAFDGYFDKYDPTDLMTRIGNHCKRNGILRTGIGETGAPPTKTNRLALCTEYRAQMDAFHAKFGVDMEFGTVWNDYDQNSAGTITWDGRMLKTSYYGGNPQTKRAPVPADWDTAYADAWFGPVGG